MNGQAKTKLLFICPNNSIFSPIAAAWARKLGGNEIQSFSAGIHSSTINETAIAVMNEAEITSSTQPAILSESLLGWPDLIIAYTNEATKIVPIPPGLQILTHTIPSQLNELDKNSMRQVRDSIFKQVHPLIEGIKKSRHKKQLRLDKKKLGESAGY